MLLIWQGGKSERMWKINGRCVGISELRGALMDYWKSVSDTFPYVSAIDIIVVDLTLRAIKSDH